MFSIKISYGAAGYQHASAALKRSYSRTSTWRIPKMVKANLALKDVVHILSREGREGLITVQ